MQAAERGLSFDSRGARTDPALPEPLARFRGPLLVSAASGTQIESAPMATMGKRDPRPARPLGSFPCRSGEPARQASASARVLAQNLQAPLPEFGEAQVAGCRVS
jgi:hypothetical protein